MAQQMKEFTLEERIHAPKEKIWSILTDFQNYEWNSVLTMKDNDSLKIGQTFQVTITKENGKQSSFKAITLSKNLNESFSAQQIMLGKWFFSATHYFILKETEKNSVVFIQKWELKGIMSSLFKNMIFKELEEFKRMNRELKALAEKSSST